MMKKTLIATATAGLIAAGTMIATTSAASADGIRFGGPGWSIGINDGPSWRGDRPHRVCRPVFETRHWRDRWGRMHFKRVVVGRDCRWGHDWRRWGHDRRGWDRGPNPGWGWGWRR